MVKWAAERRPNQTQRMEGPFGRLRAKNVHFPIGKLTFLFFFRIRFPALVRVTIPKMHKRAKSKKKMMIF